MLENMLDISLCDTEPDYDMTNVHVHVIAALIKDFLRSVPGSVLGFHNHRSWTKVCELLEPEQKIQEIKRSVFKFLTSFFHLFLTRQLNFWQENSVCFFGPVQCNTLSSVVGRNFAR